MDGGKREELPSWFLEEKGRRFFRKNRSQTTPIETTRTRITNQPPSEIVGRCDGKTWDYTRTWHTAPCPVTGIFPHIFSFVMGKRSSLLLFPFFSFPPRDLRTGLAQDRISIDARPQFVCKHFPFFSHTNFNLHLAWSTWLPSVFFSSR